MSAGHAPHTSPPWREVLSLPHTRLGWWAVGLAGPALVLGAFFQLSVIFDWTFLRHLIWAVSSMLMGKDVNLWITLPFCVLVWAISAFLIGMRKSGESR